MAYSRGRGRGLDRHAISSKGTENMNESNRLKELGDKFDSDKQQLEAALERIDNANIPESEKSKLRNEVNIAVEKLKEQYDQDVTDLENELQQEMTELAEEADANAKELQQQADDLRGIKMDAASTDASAAADAAATEQQEYEQVHQDMTRDLQLRIQQMQDQRRRIQTSKLSGR